MANRAGNNFPAPLVAVFIIALLIAGFAFVFWFGGLLPQVPAQSPTTSELPPYGGSVIVIDWRIILGMVVAVVVGFGLLIWYWNRGSKSGYSGA